MDKSFLERLYVLGEIFNEPISEVRAQGYWEALSDLDATQRTWAMREITKHVKFFPRPAEIRLFIEGSNEDHALLWLGKFRQWLGRGPWDPRNGGYSMDFPKELEPYVDAMGGWRACKQLLEDDALEFKFQFMANWRELSRREAMKELEAPVIKLLDQKQVA
jgi:hypothetical protein